MTQLRDCIFIFITWFWFASAIAQSGWNTIIPGTFSSPRIADLNGDGIDDVIFGAGRLEFQPSDSAVIALDGKSGKMLWHVAAIDQMLGSPIFQDIDHDGYPDMYTVRNGKLIRAAIIQEYMIELI